MPLQGWIKSRHCIFIRFVGVAFPPVRCSKTGLKMQNKKCKSLMQPCNGIRSYSCASHLYRLSGRPSAAACQHLQSHKGCSRPSPARPPKTIRALLQWEIGGLQKNQAKSQVGWEWASLLALIVVRTLLLAWVILTRHKKWLHEFGSLERPQNFIICKMNWWFSKKSDSSSKKYLVHWS